MLGHLLFLYWYELPKALRVLLSLLLAAWAGFHAYQGWTQDCGAWTYIYRLVDPIGCAFFLCSAAYDARPGATP